MRNQESKRKRQRVGWQTYFFPSTLARLRAASKKTGLDMTDIVERGVLNALRRLEKEHNGRHKFVWTEEEEAARKQKLAENKKPGAPRGAPEPAFVPAPENDRGPEIDANDLDSW